MDVAGVSKSLQQNTSMQQLLVSSISLVLAPNTSQLCSVHLLDAIPADTVAFLTASTIMGTACVSIPSQLQPIHHQVCQVLLTNFGSEPVKIKKGRKVAKAAVLHSTLIESIDFSPMPEYEDTLLKMKNWFLL